MQPLTTTLKLFLSFLLFFLQLKASIQVSPTIKPNIDSDYLPLSISENVVSKKLNITSWDVTDPDGGTTFSYLQLDSSYKSYFSVDSTNGLVTVIKSIDYENDLFKDGEAEIYIQVTDAQSEKATYNLTIKITDVNEFNPKFPQTTYSATSVSEDVLIYSSILKMPANDLDGGEYGVITYTVNAPGSTYFAVDFNGILVAHRQLDREAFKKLTFKVLAKDAAGGSDSCTVSVTLVNVNDNIPYFQTAVLNFEVSSNSEIYTSVGQIKAIDKDAEGTILTYALYNGSKLDEHFTMGAVDGQLTTNMILEDGKTYTFYIQADDGGTPKAFKSNPVLVRIDTFDAEAHITDWEVSVPEGTVFTESHHTQLMLSFLAKQCTPCVPKLAKQTTSSNGNQILSIYFLQDNSTGSNSSSNPIGKRFMHKDEVLSKWSDGKGHPNTNAISATPVPGTLVNIGENIVTEKPNWWLDTHAGRFCIFLIIAILLFILVTLLTFLLDWFWWSARPEKFYDKRVLKKDNMDKENNGKREGGKKKINHQNIKLEREKAVINN